MIREAGYDDLQPLLELYLHLHERKIPENTEHLQSTWKQMLDDKNHHIIVCEEDGKIVSSCICVIIPNLTRGVRPYAFIENVVTHRDYRKRGLASKCLDYAKEIALNENCYKMMLLTSSKNPKTLRFYRKAGYNSIEKKAFLQRLK